VNHWEKLVLVLVLELQLLVLQLRKIQRVEQIQQQQFRVK